FCVFLLDVPFHHRDRHSFPTRRSSDLFKEQGGAEEDGLVYLRRGQDDISIGDSSYAQVRIKVGDSHYIKGMAIYKDDMPEGVDIDRKSTRLNSSHVSISYAVFCLKTKK